MKNAENMGGGPVAPKKMEEKKEKKLSRIAARREENKDKLGWKRRVELNEKHEGLYSAGANMIDLVAKMTEVLDGEEYDTVIGDDASGRVPALVLREVMRIKAKDKHPDMTDRDLGESVKTYFAVGGHEFNRNKEAVSEFLKTIKPKIKKRAIYITEYVSSGASLAAFAECAKEAGIKIDVAVMVTDMDNDGPWQGVKNANFAKIEDLGSKIFIGANDSVPKIYSASTLSGVFSNLMPEAGGGAHKVGYRYGIVPRKYTEEYKEQEGEFNNDPRLLHHREGVEESREWVKIIAKDIIEEVEEIKSRKEG